MQLTERTTFEDGQSYFAFAMGGVNAICLIVMIYYEFVVQKRPLQKFNTLLIIMELFVVINYFCFAIKLKSGDGLPHTPSFVIISWLDYCQSVSFFIILSCYLGIMYFRSRSLFLSQQAWKASAVKGLTIASLVSLWSSNFVFLAATVRSASFGNSFSDDTALLLNKRISIPLSILGGAFLVFLDIFYIFNFRGVLRLSSHNSNNNNNNNNSHNIEIGVVNSTSSSNASSRDPLKIVSRYGTYCAISSLLTLIAFIIGSFCGNFYLPVFIIFNVTVWLLFLMKTRIDKGQERNSSSGSRRPSVGPPIQNNISNDARLAQTTSSVSEMVVIPESSTSNLIANYPSVAELGDIKEITIRVPDLLAKAAKRASDVITSPKSHSE